MERENERAREREREREGRRDEGRAHPPSAPLAALSPNPLSPCFPSFFHPPLIL